MKTINLKHQRLKVQDLLQLAKLESLFILSEDGHHYILEEADEFDKEVAVLGESDKFMNFLSERSEEKATVSIDELEKKLNL